VVRVGGVWHRPMQTVARDPDQSGLPAAIVTGPASRRMKGLQPSEYDSLVPSMTNNLDAIFIALVEARPWTTSRYHVE